MDWPSKNVARGGVFHTAKVNYSPETRDFLKTLIKETQMTTEQRNKVAYSLRTGDPLPPNDHLNPGSGKPNKYEVKIRPGSSKRRSLRTILESGAYEPDRYKPIHPRVDREVVKKELQDRMAFGKTIRPQPPKVEEKVVEEKVEEMNRFDELKMEIEDRQKWLQEMEELGQGEKHRSVINQQIQEKLREMERLKVCPQK